MAKIKEVNLIQTGGTIGMSRETGVLSVSSKAQNELTNVLAQIPNNRYTLVPVLMSGDSSDHPRSDLIDLGKTVLKHEKDSDGTIVAFGTDSMNITAATLALMGNEVYETPVVLVGSVRDFEDPRTDAPANAISGGVFTAHADASGVF